MAQEQGQRWVKFDAAGSISGVYMITGMFIDSPTAVATLKAPYSSTTRTLISVTSWTGAVPIPMAVQGTIVASTIGTGTEVYVYWR